jgi:hypothetical protein
LFSVTVESRNEHFMSEKGPKIGLKVGSRVVSTWGAYPREGVIVGTRGGGKFRVRFARTNLVRLCGDGELELAAETATQHQPERNTTMDSKKFEDTPIPASNHNPFAASPAVFSPASKTPMIPTRDQANPLDQPTGLQDVPGGMPATNSAPRE